MRVKIVPFMLTGNVGAVTDYCYVIQNTCYECEVRICLDWTR